MDPETSAELDPFNSNMGLWNPYQFPPDPPLPHKPNIFYPGFGLGSNQACRVDAVDTPCNEAMQVVNNHAGEVHFGPIDPRFRKLEDGRRVEFIGDYLIVAHRNYTQDGNDYYYQGMNFVGIILPQNRATRPEATFDEKKLRDCVKAYGIDPETVKFKQSKPGDNGYFIGYPNGDNMNEVGVVNDVGYNSRQLGNMGLVDHPIPGGTFSQYGGLPSGKRRNGKRVIVDSYTPYRNYTSSDVSNPLDMVAIQIHELGHSLSLITKKYPYTDPSSRTAVDRRADGGTYLERCVFGGEVLNGRLYK